MNYIKQFMDVRIGNNEVVYVVCEPDNVYIGEITEEGNGRYQYRNNHNTVAFFKDNSSLSEFKKLVLATITDRIRLHDMDVKIKADGTVIFTEQGRRKPLAKIAPCEETNTVIALLMSGEDIMNNEPYRQYLESNGYIEY